MCKVIVIGDGINFELDGVADQAAPNIMRQAIAAKYGPVKIERLEPRIMPAPPVSPPASSLVPDPEQEPDHEQNQDGEPP